MRFSKRLNENWSGELTGRCCGVESGVSIPRSPGVPSQRAEPALENRLIGGQDRRDRPPQGGEKIRSRDIPVPTAPRVWTGCFGLLVPGSAASFKLSSITAEGNERGSNAVTVTRPA